ncbi:polysaccharide biosynthesis protein [archaeon SCG-AAA382B04]|nr:polysaccharide biosynthesis protein [archaeon SCG-AAA382B04]
MDIAKSSIGVFISKIGIAAVGFIGTLIAARIAGATALGIYFLFYAVFHLTSLFTDLGVSGAGGKRVSEEKERGNFLTATLISKIILFSLVAIILILFKGKIVDYIGNEDVFPFLLLVLFLEVVRTSLRSGLIGEKKVARSSFLGVIQNGGRVLTWAILLFLGFGVMALVSGLFIGLLLSVIVGFFILSINFKKPQLRHFKSIFSFSKYSWIGSLRGPIVGWMDSLVLGFFVLPKFVGYYEVCWSLAGIFLFVGDAIGMSLFPNFSSLASRGKISKLEDILEEALIFSGIIVIPGIIGAVILGTSILNIYGKEFSIGYIVLVVLVSSKFFQSYEVVFSNVINGLDRPDLMFKVNSVLISLNITLNIFLIYVFGWIGASFASLVSLIIASGMSFNYAQELITVNFPRKEIGFEFFSVALMGFFVYVFNSLLFPLNVFEILILVGSGGIIYFSCLFFLSERIKNIVIRVSKNLI